MQVSQCSLGKLDLVVLPICTQRWCCDLPGCWTSWTSRSQRGTWSKVPPTHPHSKLVFTKAFRCRHNMIWNLTQTGTLDPTCIFVLFRWFEELGPICELLENVSKIGVSEIKSPIGSLVQKYVSSSFMVKMRIDLGSFGLFWFILGWG